MQRAHRILVVASSLIWISSVYACSSASSHPPVAGDQGGGDASNIPSDDASTSDATSAPPDSGSAGASDSGVPTICTGTDNKFIIQGDDYIAQKMVTVIQGGAGWTAQIEKTVGGLPSFVTINYLGSGATFWSADFSSDGLGKSLAVGTYTAAQRASFAASGHAGLDVGGDGRGCNTLSGTFTVADIQWAGGSSSDAGSDADATDAGDAGPLRITSFTATFEQHCENAAIPATGCIHFQQ